MKKKQTGAVLLIALWLLLTLWAWGKPAQDVSEAERRKLAKFPTLSAQSLLSGSFMEDFETYTMDQFPLRETFRQVKSLFHYYVLAQGDNNGIYLADGSAAKLEYPLNEKSVAYAAEHFNAIYEKYLRSVDGKCLFAVVPDKSYYLAQANGYPAMDYAALTATLEEALPWATFVDIGQYLDGTDYYRTDSHWRQEQLEPVARHLTESLGVGVGSFTQKKLDVPFYGVYYGQAALPMPADEIVILESEILSQCRVLNHETGKETGIYDLEKLAGRDPYEVYLSGATALLTVTNPMGDPQRQLIVFRDSFGSSLVPLLLEDYGTVTLVDTRYVAHEILGSYVNFQNSDILFLYSTSVLNNSFSLK